MTKLIWPSRRGDVSITGDAAQGAVIMFPGSRAHGCGSDGIPNSAYADVFRLQSVTRFLSLAQQSSLPWSPDPQTHDLRRPGWCGPTLSFY